MMGKWIWTPQRCSTSTMGAGGPFRDYQWFSIVQDQIWSIEENNCNQCNSAMIMPGMHRVCPHPLLVSPALCWTGFSTSLAAGRCNEHLSTSFFFPSFFTKLLMARVCSLVFVLWCPLQWRKVWRHLSQCAFSFFLYAGTPPRVLDKKKKNTNKVFTTHNGQRTHRDLDERTRYLPGMQ